MKFGVDVGGTTVKIGVVDQKKILDKFEIITTKETLIEDICRAILAYQNDRGIKTITGIGFGMPGNIRNNYIYNLPNIGIKEMDLVQEVHRFIPDVPVASGNDANVAALGEMIYHQEYENACMITLGTGVGGGIILGGHILEGVHGNAGEIGHMPIADDYNFDCGCGLKGCLETVASATGIVRLARHHRNDFQSQLKEPFTAKDIFQLAVKNDPLCCFVVDRLCYYLAKCIAVLSVVVDVDVYYIGGGVSKAGSVLVDGIIKHYRQMAHFAVKDVTIQQATLLNDAGMLGAASLIED